MNAKPMKEDELRKMACCTNCNEKVGEKRVPIIWKLKAERHFLDLQAIERQQGLGLMLGHGGLAAVMGPNENMTTVMAEHTIALCDQCAASGVNIMALCEASEINDGDEDDN